MPDEPQENQQPTVPIQDIIPQNNIVATPVVNPVQTPIVPPSIPNSVVAAPKFQ